MLVNLVCNKEVQENGGYRQIWKVGESQGMMGGIFCHISMHGGTKGAPPTRACNGMCLPISLSVGSTLIQQKSTRFCQSKENNICHSRQPTFVATQTTRSCMFAVAPTLLQLFLVPSLEEREGRFSHKPFQMCTST